MADPVFVLRHRRVPSGREQGGHVSPSLLAMSGPRSRYVRSWRATLVVARPAPRPSATSGCRSTEVANHFTSTHPRSPFVRTLTVQRSTRTRRFAGGIRSAARPRTEPSTPAPNSPSSGSGVDRDRLAAGEGVRERESLLADQVGDPQVRGRQPMCSAGAPAPGDRPGPSRACPRPARCTGARPRPSGIEMYSIRARPPPPPRRRAPAGGPPSRQGVRRLTDRGNPELAEGRQRRLRGLAGDVRPCRRGTGSAPPRRRC